MADLDARVLLCAACGIDHGELVRDPDVAIGEAAAALRDSAVRRLAREPVSRILGRREFWGLPLFIDATVLDPRPETEDLVAVILKAMRERRDGSVVLDLGTGTGAILCALLHELPQVRAVGVDRSPAACRIARRNLDGLGLGMRAALVCASWFDALSGRFDCIVSNPPYIRQSDIATLAPEVAAFDPTLALDGGPDGFAAYRAIIPRLRDWLVPGGLVALECGSDQGEALATMLRSAGMVRVVVHPDLAGRDRVVSGATPEDHAEGHSRISPQSEAPGLKSLGDQVEIG